MKMPARLAVVAVISVFAVGAALLVARPGQPAVAGPSPAPRSERRPRDKRGPHRACQCIGHTEPVRHPAQGGLVDRHRDDDDAPHGRHGNAAA